MKQRLDQLAACCWLTVFTTTPASTDVTSAKKDGILTIMDAKDSQLFLGTSSWTADGWVGFGLDTVNTFRRLWSATEPAKRKDRTESGPTNLRFNF